MPTRFRWLAATAALLALEAAAQYPSKPIHFVVPFAAGGSADAAARAVAAPMSKSLGQTIVVENRPGADGVIAAEYVARSAADGYTLFFATATSMSAVPALRKSLSYDPLADFTPVSMVCTFGFFLIVHQELPVKTAKELIDYARANPGKLNYGTGNATSMIATAQFKQLYGLDMTHVPYKGDAPAVTDLAAGRVQLMFVTGTALPFVKDGRLRALATLTPSRSALLPDVPTMEEAGVRNVSIVPWCALAGPAKLPKDVVARLNRAVKDALAEPEVKQTFAAVALEARGSTPEEMTAFLRDQLEAYRKTSQAAGIMPD